MLESYTGVVDGPDANWPKVAYEQCFLEIVDIGNELVKDDKGRDAFKDENEDGD